MWPNQLFSQISYGVFPDFSSDTIYKDPRFFQISIQEGFKFVTCNEYNSFIFEIMFIPLSVEKSLISEEEYGKRNTIQTFDSR